MSVSRREFMSKSVGALGAAGVLGALGARAAAEEVKAKVGACGLCCETCPLMNTEKCKGCGAAKAVSAEMVEKKACPVLSCAKTKDIEYCGTGCAKFMECGKLIGRPYAKEFMEMMKKRMA